MSVDALINLILTYKYLFILPAAVIEGPVISMICGFLLRLNYFTFFSLYFVLMLGDLLGDILWYYLGYHFGHRFIRRFGKYVSITEEKIALVEKFFHRYHASILFISKITTGFGFSIVTLFTAGLVRVPFKKYILLNVSGQFIWTGMLIAVGYFFGELYTRFNKGLEIMWFVAALIIFIAVMYGFGNYLRNRLIIKGEQEL